MPEAGGVPVDFAVIEFPMGHRPLAGELATELASLHDAELIHILAVAVVEKDEEGTVGVVASADLGDLAELAERLPSLREPDELVELVGALAAGSVGAVVVWENTWVEPLVALARWCGGELVADGRLRTASPDLGDDDGACAPYRPCQGARRASPR